MYPHERSLVKKYEGRPFALLGVNTDSDVQTLRDAEKKGDVTWRSWWDGSGGPITRAWGVDGFPTVFLIDAQGVVQYAAAPPDEKELDRRIEDLVRAAENQ